MGKVTIEGEHRPAAREIIARWLAQPALEKASHVLTKARPVTGEERELIRAHERLGMLLRVGGDDPSPIALEREQAVTLLTSLMLELRYAPEPAKEFVELADVVSAKLRVLDAGG